MAVLEELKSLGQGLGNFFVQTGKAVLRAGPRAAASVTLDATGRSTYQPGAPGGVAPGFERFLLGSESIESLRRQTDKLPERATKYGIPQNIGKKIAVPLVIGSAILDLVPIAGGRGKLIESIAKETSEVGVKNLLKNGIKNIGESEVSSLAKRLAPIQDQNVVKQTLEEFVKTASKERGFVTSVKEKFPTITKVAGQYIPRSTDELSMKAKNLIQDDIEQATRLAMTGSDDNAVATASELIKHYGNAAANAPDTSIKAAFEDKIADVANTIAKKLTEQGRSIQAASILGRMTPEGQVRFAAREIQKFNEAADASRSPLAQKIPELTGEQAGKIVEQMKGVAKMPDGVEKAQRFQELQNGIFDLIPSSLLKKISTVWKAGLLTGIKTSGLNILSNVSHFTTETLKDIPASAVDSVASLFTGKRTMTLTLKGTAGGLQEGFEKGFRYFRTGFDERNMMAKLDYKRVNFGSNPVSRTIRKYEETVFRILGSEDQPFYYGMKARSLFDQALAQGKNLGLRADELKEFANDLVKSPTDEMLRYAAIDAETTVFQNKTALGEAAKSIQDIGKGTQAEGVGDFIIPFSRTPSAVASQIINYSPIGIVKAIVKSIGKGKFDQRLFAQEVGRGITGTGFLYLGTKLFDNNLITLDFPQGEREQKLWEAEGRKPNSIKIGDDWRTTQSLGPVGNLLIVGAHFQRKYKETGSATQGMAQALVGGAKSFTEQTFLQGVRNLTEAINDPERFADAYFGNLTASFVPTISSDIARAKDQVERRTRTVLERVEARIPFLREELEPKIDILGREQAVGGNPLETMIDPTRPSRDVSTPVIQELRSLASAGYKVSPTLLGSKHGYESLTAKQNTELWKDTGQLISSKLGKLIIHPDYLTLPSDQRAKVIEDFIGQSKIIARAKQVLEITQDLTGDDLKAELSKQKKGGLLTREVYDKYLELR